MLTAEKRVFMEDPLILLPQDIYLQHLQSIKGIELTPREIDVLACCLNGRSTKTIPSFLSIASRTVASHMSRIKLKTGCTSQENVVDFIKSSDKFSIIKNQYYPSLLTRITFEKYLKQIPRAGSAQRPLCLLIYSREQKDKHTFISYLEGHLKLAGFNVETKIKENYKDFIELQEETTFDSTDYILYVAPKTPITIDQQEGVFADKFIFLSPDQILSEVSDELKKNNYIDFSTAKDYYFSFFEILKKIKTDYNFDNVISEFTQSCKATHTSSETIPLESPLETKEKAKDQKANVFFNMLRERFKIFALGLLSLGIIGALLFSNGWNLRDSNTKPIVTNMPTLTNSAFLIRPELMMRLNDTFKGRGGIQVVALIGIGGIGKTTTARQYARQQQSQVIWEINAETEESLKSSFEKLALHLDKTEEDKKILREIREIKNPAEKEEKIVLFVQEHLKSQSNWFLLYDNAKKFSDIQKYFPQDSKLWGAGKIIITTQNTNIENNTQVSHLISVEELSEEQKFNLFSKIMDRGSMQSFATMQKAETSTFLENIPPFPLDVSVAAYYLKTSNISYAKYLENLENYTDEFNNVQENLLKEAGAYFKTRYGIITQSLERLMRSHKDFEGLLFLITLLDSQDVPRELLRQRHSDASIDNFMYHLKKYSLITDASSILGTDTLFSIHRSTQNISFIYLTKILKLGNNKELIKEIVYALDDYADQVIEQENFSKMHALTRHLERFMQHRNLSTDFSKALLESRLGVIYYFINDNKYRKIIDNSFDKLKIRNLEQLSSKDTARLLRALFQVGVVYTELRRDEEAQKILEHVIKIYGKKGLENYTELSWALSHLGNLERRLGNYKKAKDYLEESVRLHKQYGRDHKRLARTLAYLGATYRGLATYQKAIDTLNESLVIYKENASKNHVRIGWILVQLGNVYRNLGDFQNAKEYFEKGLSIFKKYLPKNHMDTGLVLACLGNCYRDLGDYEKSRDYLEESLKIHQKYFEEDHRKIGWGLFYLARTYKAMGKDQEAQKLFDKVFKIYTTCCHIENIKTTDLLRDMASICIEQNRLDVAKNLIKRALNILHAHNHPDIYRLFEVLGEIYLKKSLESQENNNSEAGKLKLQALATFNQALKTAEQHLPKNSAHIERIKLKLQRIE